jgi:hydrogenase expression/formation protein HypE
MRRLIREQILPAIDNKHVAQLGDAAVLPAIQGQLAMSTDSFVVSPLFFPGGDIGSLAVYGTVNDLAVAGAIPRWISLSLIAEEGLPTETLSRVMQSVANAAQRVGVQVATGDTKIVPRGAADGLFLNTTGIGELIPPLIPGPAKLTLGDQLLVSGPVGRHGMAVMASREGLAFDPPPTSDSGPLIDAVGAIRSARIQVKAMRDATRGGLAAVLHEWAEASELTLAIDEASLPVTPEVRGACEVLGLDPVHVANEGTMLIAVPERYTQAALCALRDIPETSHAARVGEVRNRTIVPVVVQRSLGQEVALDEPLGAPLPRIC